MQSRKLWVAVSLFLVSTILLVGSYIVSAEWVDMVKWVFGLYAAGNVGEHYTNRRKGTP